MFEPKLTVLEIETRLCEVAKKFGLEGEFVADGCACSGAEGCECGEDCEEAAEAEVCEGVVAEEADEGGVALSRKTII